MLDILLALFLFTMTALFHGANEVYWDHVDMGHIPVGTFTQLIKCLVMTLTPTGIIIMLVACC